MVIPKNRPNSCLKARLLVVVGTNSLTTINVQQNRRFRSDEALFRTAAPTKPNLLT